MKIKQLELHGFKSFVDRTLVELPEGVTGVVGPNGCGKSNIVDAIRWVLGEQSSKNLRGRSMEDIIFNGSETRAPTGLAEVILTFDNKEGLIGGPYSSYSEVSIGRRLFRSGESEYLVNKQSVRLRDIQEIFMDTGLGSRAHYSIIEQGKVALVLSAKAEDRRVLIEEAAGISKFKARKDSALRKIDSTKQNLLRITDVVSEVKRQMDYMKRQAQKAERYVKIKDQALVLEGKLWKVDYREQRLLHDDVTSRLGEIQSQQESYQSRLSGTETRIETLRLETLESEKKVQDLQGRYSSNEHQQNLMENDIDHFNLAVAGIVARRDTHLDQMQQAKDALSRTQTEEEEARVSLEQGQRKEEEFAEILKNSEVELTGLENDVQEMERKQDLVRDQINGLVTQIVNGGTTLDNLDRQRIDLSGRLARSQVEFEENEKRYSALRQVLSRNEEKLQGVEQLQLELKTKVTFSQGSVEELSEARNQLENECGELKEKCTTSKSRLNVLRELQTNYEGLHDGVRSIMMYNKEKSENGNGILGLVADLINLPKQYERAAEAVLGERLQYVVVKSQEEGLHAIDYLNQQSAGRSTFIPLGGRFYDEEVSSSTMSDEGVVGPMSQLVQVSGEYQKMIRYLFGNVVVVDNLKNALKIWSKNGIKRTLVTLEGEVLDSYGVVSGGHGGKYQKVSREELEEGQGLNDDIADASHLLQRKRAIQDLENEISELQTRLKDKERNLEDITRKLNQMRIEVESIEKDRHQEELRLVKHQKDLSQIQEDCRRCEENLQKIQQRKFEEEKAVEEFKSEQEKVVQGVRLAKEEKNQLEQEQEKLKSVIIETVQKREDLKDKVLQSRVHLAEIREQRSGFEREFSRLENEMQDRQQQVDHLMAEINRGTEEEQHLKEKKLSSESKIKELISQNEIVEGELVEARGVYDEKFQQLKEREGEIRHIRQERDRIQKELSQLEVKATQAKMNLDTLEQKAIERQNVSLEILIEEAMGDETPLFVAEDEDVGEFGDDSDGSDRMQAQIDRVREQLAELKKQMDSIGEVNLAAITELEDLTARHIFLNRQKDDLEGSIEILQKTIYRVNKTSRERFKETFDAVNKKFHEIFPRLFGGGKASLVLTDESDLLETGIDIVCQPPGKKIQNVNLLSGGEKALVSICLILAIFLIKPSPFCLLDEVDAPLDDANISRFNELLKELAKESQLILITHNRHTMEIADFLYGVTMEEAGISRLVSVKMN